jgi:hypothetical protein
MLVLEPAATEPEDGAAVRDLIHRRDHFREQARVAVRVAGHQVADPCASRRMRERAEHRPSFQARTARVGEDRIEVIERPQRVVAPRLGGQPELFDGRPFHVLLAGLNSETNGMLCHDELLQIELSRDNEFFVLGLRAWNAACSGKPDSKSAASASVWPRSDVPATSTSGTHETWRRTTTRARWSSGRTRCSMRLATTA